MKSGHGPDFVCIGAQKAGTTWLFDNLAVHPQIWLPPVKEIHYFDLACPHEELLGIEVDQIPKGMGKLRQLCAQRSLAELRWVWRFYDSHRTIGWYRGLFDDFAGDRTSGDITPAYSTLDERGVAFAARVLHPACRVLAILRNPIERIWSGLKMSYRWQQREVAAADCERVVAEMNLPENRLRTDYRTMLERWGRAFGERFRVFLYDDLVAEPVAFLHAVEQHIGVAPFADTRLLAQRSNADARAVAMPEALRTRLVALYRDDIVRLESMLPQLSGRWLQSLD